MQVGWGVAACVATMVAGCGQAAGPPLLRAQPSSYLLTVDQLVSPDFTVDVAPHALTVDDVAAGGTTARQLDAAGYLAGAREDFFRSAGSLAEVNGPVQVGDTVEEFSSAAGAASAYSVEVAGLDAAPGATPTSTGALGDAAHATARSASAADGTIVVEFTVEWRVDNLLDVLVVRGRGGGTRLDDALLLAHRQTVSELGLGTPAAVTSTNASP